MNHRVVMALAALVSSLPATTLAQNPLPTSQPTVLTIYREDVKYGHGADHEKTEAAWPAAYAKAKSPYTYIGITSLTGGSEAWFLAPYADWKGYGESIKMESDNSVLAAELAQAARADAEHVSSGRVIHLVGRPDLSAGTFPNVAKVRFYEISTFRVRPGHEQGFEQAAKIYGAAFKKAAPQGSYRIYQVVAGMPSPTFLVFSSVESLAELDKMQAMEGAVWAAFSPDDLRALQKFMAEGVINTENQRFAVNARMSYVDDATANQDPAFWRPQMKASK